MKHKVQYGTKELEFKVEFRDRDTMSISVEPPNNILVVVPTGTSEDEIKDIVKSKGYWIVQKLFEFRNIESKKVNREFVNGESFMYLGRNYSLQIYIDKTLQNNSKVKLFRGKFHVYVKEKNDELIKVAMEAWYREKTEEQVKKRIKYYQKFFDKKPSDIKIKEQKKRWASCTSKNELLFNWRCAMAKAPALDYIVVHEMCHMYYMNHSQEFWDLLASVMSDYEIRKEWLRDYGIRMDL
ncbi:SprT family zinc-dependent metalloprotease [Clostridium sp. C8]|uniref:M48 family metallopeptidase n=1 Tax=Clostridium sp. C8 TaxID=1667357 RepID=UPI00062E3BC5|nr:SprT family zinc-dependent metalloprotease [Clostridium sp. C8]KLE17147.1 metal-dependent hydrolase [Clostridium sp. C8]